VEQTLSTSLFILFHVRQMIDDPSGEELAARPLPGAASSRQVLFVLLVYRTMTLNMLL
jgi:hypothetical protein